MTKKQRTVSVCLLCGGIVLMLLALFLPLVTPLSYNEESKMVLLIGGGDDLSEQFIPRRTPGYFRCILMTLGTALSVTACTRFKLDGEDPREKAAHPATLLAISATGGFGLGALVCVLGCFLANTRHTPGELKGQIFAGIGCFLFFVLFLWAYFHDRGKGHSRRDILWEACFATLYAMPFYYLNGIVYEFFFLK